MSRTARIALGILVALVIAWGVAVVVDTPVEARGGPCICPQIYAPVQCDNGKTYPNQCVADCRHAKNCVPTGAI
jgi:hypothetical protein